MMFPWQQTAIHLETIVVVQLEMVVVVWSRNRADALCNSHYSNNREKANPHLGLVPKLQTRKWHPGLQHIVQLCYSLLFI